MRSEVVMKGKPGRRFPRRLSVRFRSVNERDFKVGYTTNISQTGMFVGAHIIGTQAASLIQPLIQAMQFDQPADVVADDVFYIHPALTEVVENALLDAIA